jgi:hypothetical protein
MSVVLISGLPLCKSLPVARVCLKQKEVKRGFAVSKNMEQMTTLIPEWFVHSHFDAEFIKSTIRYQKQLLQDSLTSSMFLLLDLDSILKDQVIDFGFLKECTKIDIHVLLLFESEDSNQLRQFQTFVTEWYHDHMKPELKKDEPQIGDEQYRMFYRIREHPKKRWVCSSVKGKCTIL